MMLRALVTASLILGTVQAAQASDSLKGTWKYVDQQCASGAKHNPSTASSYSFKANLVLTIGSHQMFMHGSDVVKYTAAGLADMNKALESSRETIAQMSEGPDKVKALADLTQWEKQMAEYGKGFSCQFKDLENYSVLKGSLIRTTSVKSSTVCSIQSSSPADKSDDKPDTSFYVVRGDKLVITDADAETKDDQECPKGDRAVSTFVRVK